MSSAREMPAFAIPAVSAVDVRRVALFTRWETRATVPPDPPAMTSRSGDPLGWTQAIATSAPTTGRTNEWRRCQK